MAFRARSRHHLPRKKEQEGGGFLLFRACSLPPPPSHATARRRWISTSFRLHSPSLPPSHARVGGGFSGELDPLHSAATSPHTIASRMSAFMALQPRFHRAISLACNSESEVVCMAFRPHSCCCHLPCMQRRRQAAP